MLTPRARRFRARRPRWRPSSSSSWAASSTRRARASPVPTGRCVTAARSRAMVGGILYEHSHRLAATAVGILTVVLALVLRREGRGRLGPSPSPRSSCRACLGGATVLLQLPPLVSIAHLALSMAFFAYLVGLAVPRRVDVGAAVHRALARRRAARLPSDRPRRGRPAHPLGARVRERDSRLLRPALAGGRAVQAQIHMAHRLFGVLVAAVVATTGVACARRLRGGLRLLALALPVLVLVQIGLGVWTVLTLKALVPVELHLAVGALLLAVTTTLAVATRAGNARRPWARSSSSPSRGSRVLSVAHRRGRPGARARPGVDRRRARAASPAPRSSSARRTR